MAASKKKFELSLGTWIFLIIALLVVLITAAVFVASWILGERFAQGSAKKALESSQSVQIVLQQERYRRLQLISRIFSTDRLLTTYLTEAAEARDPVSILDALENYQNLLTFDLAVVLDQDGIVLGRTDDRQAFGDDLSADPIIAVALEEKQAFGVWQQGDDLYHAAALPLVRNFDQVGFIVVALSINEALARQIQRIGSADTVFLVNSATGPTVAASTLDPAASAELVSSLRLKGEILNRVTQRGETADQVSLPLQERERIAFLAPLRDASDRSMGAAVTLTSFDERLADYRLLQLLLLGLAGVALILGWLFSRLLSNRMLRPLSTLAQAAEQASRGDYSAALPAGGPGHVGQLGTALGELFDDLSGQQSLDFYVSRVQRFLPEPSKGGGMAKAKAHPAVLLAIELRRFANPKIGYDPEENLGRLSRDLRRISATASARQGRLEAVFGHRALIVFDGDGAVSRALSVATELLHQLSERENVFDEAEPPVVALAGGPVITGSVVWGDQPSPAVAGLPIQLLESLLREAAPGDIYLSKNIHAVLAEPLQRIGVEAKAQRGLLSPQPLYVLSGEAAARATGFVPSPEASGGLTDERRSVSDIQPGILLGGRYDVMAQLGAGRMGSIFKAQDRELGDIVVLKMLKPEVVADSARFEQLMRIVGQARNLRHPNVLDVIDFGEIESMPYISTQFVRAVTLRYLLDQTGRLDIAAALYLTRQIGWGLAAAHREELLHLGLKPENVLIEPQGRAKIMDFGISTAATETISGVPYLAPEQLEGRAVDVRTDVYALGALLYHLLSGQPPYAGSTIEEIRQQHMMQDPAPLGTILDDPQPELEQIVARSLSKAVEQRYSAVDELLADLGKLTREP
ncbi:MAG: protein kinase [Acidobacteriota bacterium]